MIQKRTTRLRQLALALVLMGSVAVAAAQNWTRVATNECGNPNAQPFLVLGENYTFPATITTDPVLASCNVGGRLIYAFDKLDIQADYQLEVAYISDGAREIRLTTDGAEVHPDVVLEKGKEKRLVINLPKRAYAYGQLVLVFEALRLPNVVVSELNLNSTNPKAAAPFEGERKEALVKTQSYKVEKNLDMAAVLPQYAPVPQAVNGVYNPKVSLNGVWQFAEKAPAQVSPATMGAIQWSDIQVPGQWSSQGFKVDSAGFGVYNRTFDVPTDWKGKLIRLRFDGVSSECEIFLNYQKIGEHMGGMTAFELDLTQAIKAGKNTLSLRVRSESTADMLGSLTQYAAHQLGGITRKVTLFAVPELYVSDLRVITDLDAQYQDATLQVEVTVRNGSNKAQAAAQVRASLAELGISVATQIPAIAAGGVWTGVVEAQVKAPKKWDSEHPNLYQMALELNQEGKTLEQIYRKVGFREIEIKGNEMLVNGQSIKLRGVCRHEVHPLTGRVLSQEVMRQDVELYREANCNFIRTSHYPPAEEFVALCDELGMFVEVEAPVCWVGHHANENWTRLNYRDKRYYGYVLQANMEMIQLYRNSPSVILWSMANESYWNGEFAQVLEYIRQADPTRPNAFHDQAYGGFNNQGSTADVSNIHYPGPNGFKRAAVSERPMVFGEYCHLNVYNRSELVTDPGVRSDWALALLPMWENMYQTKGALGGSLWSGIDDVFQLPDGNACGYGPWGPIDGWRRPKPEYWDMKKIFSPIQLKTKTLASVNNIELEVENRYTYTNLDQVTIEWQYGGQKGRTMAHIAPGETGRIAFSIPGAKNGQLLEVLFTDPRGFMVDQYKIPVGVDPASKLVVVGAEVATKLKKSKTQWTAWAKGFSCTIDPKTGNIISLVKDGRPVLSGGPWLMALSLSGGGCYPDHNANVPFHNELCSEWKVSSIEASQEGNSVVVKAQGTYDGFEGGYTMTINANGQIQIAYSYTATKNLDPRQWGLVFEAPSEFATTFWDREGLWSHYPDDHISRPVGSAPLFYNAIPAKQDPRTQPEWSWNMDSNELGSSDFRSTRRNVYSAGLKSDAGRSVTLASKGDQHWRSWKAGDAIQFLVAGFASPGAEMFLGSHYAPYRKPLKVGDVIADKVTLVVE